MPSTTAGVRSRSRSITVTMRNTLRGVVKPARYERSQRLFTGVTERRVPEVVPEGDGVHERLDQTDSVPHFTGNGAHLERVRETGAEPIGSLVYATTWVLPESLRKAREPKRRSRSRK